jgi:ABC-type nickel/cobalt efflux system permease component RcnA
MRRIVVLLLLLPTFSGSRSVHAHDIPNARVDRSIQVTVAPRRLAVDYEVSLSELTLTQDLRMLIGSLPGVERQDWFVAYARETGPLNARGLLVTIDQRPYELTCQGYDLTVEEHPRYVFHLEAEIPDRGRLAIRDTNYSASEGTSRLAVRGRAGVVIHGDDLPGDVQAIAIRPVWQLSVDEERRTKQAEVDYEVMPGPDLPSSTTTAAEVPVAPKVSGPAPQFGATRLTELLDRPAGRSALLGLIGLILLAAGLGAVHALQPGHGKTLVAATVLGERGNWIRGVLLAAVLTLTHTGSVLLVALALWATQTSRYGEIHLGLAHAAGFLIAAIGLWRLGRHLAYHGEHGTERNDDQTVDASGTRPTRHRGLIGLGVAGGLVPCWDAVVLVLVAEAIGRLGLGIVLVVAFGSGMGLVLVALGILAARLRTWVEQRGGPRSYGRWERRLGIATGLTLAGIGVYLLGLA